MEQVVLELTRGKNTLDLFFTTNPTLVEKVTLTPGMSDHDSIPLVIINCKPKFIKQKPRRILLYHKADLQALKNELNNWSSLFVQKDTHSCSVNELYDEFQKAIEDAMDSHIPSKTVSKKNQTPWINKRIKRLHRRKQRAFNSYKKSGDPRRLDKFNKERKDAYKETKKSYKKYIASVCSDSPKRFWSFIKSLKVDSIGIPTLKRNGKLESDNVCKAEILNDQFKSVFTVEDNNPPQESNPQIPSMPDITIHVEGVSKLLKKLNPKQSHWPRRDFHPHSSVDSRGIGPCPLYHFSKIFGYRRDTQVLASGKYFTNIQKGR